MNFFKNHIKTKFLLIFLNFKNYIQNNYKKVLFFNLQITVPPFAIATEQDPKFIGGLAHFKRTDIENDPLLYVGGFGHYFPDYSSPLYQDWRDTRVKHDFLDFNEKEISELENYISYFTPSLTMVTERGEIIFDLNAPLFLVDHNFFFKNVMWDRYFNLGALSNLNSLELKGDYWMNNYHLNLTRDPKILQQFFNYYINESSFFYKLNAILRYTNYPNFFTEDDLKKNIDKAFIDEICHALTPTLIKGQKTSEIYHKNCFENERPLITNLLTNINLSLNNPLSTTPDVGLYYKKRIPYKSHLFVEQGKDFSGVKPWRLDTQFYDRPIHSTLFEKIHKTPDYLYQEDILQQIPYHRFYNPENFIYIVRILQQDFINLYTLLQTTDLLRTLNYATSLLRYSSVFFFLLFAIGLTVIILLLSRFLIEQKGQKGDAEKRSAYECGFEPFEDARNSFDVNFYLVAILFILFDLEVVFLIPWSTSLTYVSSYELCGFYIFNILLTLGFMYEWKKGALEWY